MNHQIYKNILFYGTFGGFGIYSMYEVAKSEFNKKDKSQFYFNKMIHQYIQLKKCNFISSNEDYKNYIIQDNTNKENILKFIDPAKIKYHENCIDYYEDFQKSYNNYKLYKYEPSYKFGL